MDIPDFWALSGRIGMLPEEGTALGVDHPLNEGKFGPTFISLEWVKKIIQEHG